MIDGIVVTQEEINGQIVLEINSGKFSGCKFYYDGTTFAEHENPDGSLNMSFNYEITNDFVVDGKDSDEFNRMLGDNLLSLIEASLKSETTIFKGGV